MFKENNHNFDDKIEVKDVYNRVKIMPMSEFKDSFETSVQAFKFSDMDIPVYFTSIYKNSVFYREDLEKLQTLHMIQQRTPIRVSHRRADKIREKEVKNIESKFIDSKTFEMIIKTEGGLYIKELISSDEGRSNPSVSEVLGTQAICAELDVIEVGIK